MSGTTRRYRATDKTKTAKPKPKVSKRAALIAKVEKSGKVKLRTDWSALRKKKKPGVVKEEKKTKTRVIAKEKDSVKRRKKFVFTAKEKKMIEEHRKYEQQDQKEWWKSMRDQVRAGRPG